MMMSPNEKNKLKLRQICLIFLAFVPVTKISLLPSVLAGYCEERLWVSAILSFLMDIAVIFICMYLCKKHNNCTLFYLLKHSLGETVAKIVYFGYSCFFIIKALVPLLEQQDYIHNTLYEITPSFLVFLPIFIVSFYQSLKGLKILGRCADMAIWFTAMGIGLTIFLSITEIHFENLLPIIQKPTYKPVIASFRSVIWYTDSVYLLIFLGHFNKEKRQTLKVALSYFLAAFIIVLFMCIFYSVFSAIAKNRFFATSELTIYSFIDSARFDYVAIFLLMFPQVFAIILPLYLSAKCFERAFNLKKAIIPAAVINTAIAIFTAVFSGNLFGVLTFISTYLNYVFIFFGYVIPGLLIFIPKEKAIEKKV